MSGSNVNPNQWNGELRSGGYIAKNTKPASANSPDWKGRFYLIGYGWVWLSGWSRQAGDFIRISPQDMTDEQATKFCKPKPRVEKTRQPPPEDSRKHSKNGNGGPDSDIPF